MTSHREQPAEPLPPRPYIPHQPPSKEDLAELWEPDDTPDEPLNWMYAVVVDQVRPRQPGQPPSLKELVESMNARIRQTEPDFEAEP